MADAKQVAKKKPATKTKAVVKVKPKKPPVPKKPPLPEDPNDRMIMLAIQGDADIGKLKELIELKNRQEERENKKEFDFHFALMQAEFTPAPRSKQGDKSKYASLDVLQKHNGPVISKHGFSYRWSEEELPEGRLKVILTISGYGHSKENYKGLPAYEPDRGNTTGKPIMNVLQAEGTRSSYGERYTLIAGFGLIIEDEDTDGNFDDGVAYAEFIRKMDEETDQLKLTKLAREMYRQLKKEGDHRGAEVITKAYNRRKSGI